MRYFGFLRLFILLAFFSNGYAQSPINLATREAVAPDSADVAYYGRRHFWRAAATVTGLNLSVWAYDRYIQKADFARISLRSIRDNWDEGFNWDNDRLGTNMFLHPYHGNLYYNAARSNGFNYWQSGLFAFAGSAMWELFLENEYPSTNDIIATPIGGMAIGEVTYRVSDMIINDETRGWERLGRESAVFLLSPMRGLTRIINGDAWRHRSTPGRRFGLPNISIDASLGIRVLGVKNAIFDRGAGMTAELNIEYGDRYEMRSSSPYDYFRMYLQLGVQKSQPILDQLNIMGRLISRELIDTKCDDLSIGLYQHYDYYDSDTISAKSAITPYKLAVPASMGVGLLYRMTNRPGCTFDAFVHANAVLLGGILTDHYDLDDRNYNLASGFSFKSGANLVFGHGKFAISAKYDFYRMYTWGYPRGMDLQAANPRTLNAQGDDSNAFFGIAGLRGYWRMAPRLYLSLSFSHYYRATHYRDFDDVHSSSFTTRLMLTYKL